MARSHHRKKHKEHLRQFKHTHEKSTSSTAKGKAVWVFTIGGAIVGLMITYFAAKGNIPWTLAGLLAGAILGFIAGKKLDKTAV
ncbi:MAG: hypothetical protein JNL23_01355 [Chitinophagaceae bacterium]|nr:hypothetical protein [Chitinophagaceae bacterium]